MTPNDLLAALRWRYACKSFDNKTIPAEVWSAIEEALILSPSSYGLQPWRFVVVTNPSLKAQLKGVSWNQRQVEDCSHLVALCAKETMTVADVDHFMSATTAARGTPVEKLAGYRDMIIGDVVNGPRSKDVFNWASRQVYIAFGQVMASAAVLGIDACPLEGISPRDYDRILGLHGSGYRTIAACVFGYRNPQDAYATAAKVRYPASEVILRRP